MNTPLVAAAEMLEPVGFLKHSLCEISWIYFCACVGRRWIVQMTTLDLIRLCLDRHCLPGSVPFGAVVLFPLCLLLLLNINFLRMMNFSQHSIINYMKLYLTLWHKVSFENFTYFSSGGEIVISVDRKVRVSVDKSLPQDETADSISHPHLLLLQGQS
jgi:hypothetical protein